MRTQIWAHRGSSHTQPENTMAAFRQAVADGADGIEIDVQRTKDGEVVVCHDEHLLRLAGVNRELAALTWTELSELNVAHHAGGTEHRVPLLSEVLELIHDSGLQLNIELKNSINPFAGLENDVLSLVAEYGVTEQVCYSSFNHVSMARLAASGHGPDCGLLTSNIIYRPVAYATACGAGAWHPLLNSLQQPDYVRICHDAGLKVHAWTADEPAHINACLLSGIDALITNEPVLALDLRDVFEADGGASALASVREAGLFNSEQES